MALSTSLFVFVGWIEFDCCLFVRLFVVDVLCGLQRQIIRIVFCFLRKFVLCHVVHLAVRVQSAGWVGVCYGYHAFANSSNTSA